MQVSPCSCRVPDLDGQGINVRPQREAGLLLGADGGHDAGPCHRVLEGDAHRLQLLAQVGAGALLLEAQLRVLVQSPATFVISVYRALCRLSGLLAE